MKKQDNKVLKNDYDEYVARRKAAKGRNDGSAQGQTTLRYLLVFGLTILMFICMILPDFRAYIWSDSLGWSQERGIIYGGNVFSILSMFGGSGSSVDVSGGSLDEVIKDNPIIDMFLNGSDAFDDVFFIIKLLTILLVIQLIFIAAQFVLSMCAVCGADKLDPFIKTVAVATVVLSIAIVVLSSLIYVKEGLFFETVSMTVKCSFGSMVVLAVALAQTAVALFVRR